MDPFFGGMACGGFAGLLVGFVLATRKTVPVNQAVNVRNNVGEFFGSEWGDDGDGGNAEQPPEDLDETIRRHARGDFGGE